VKYRILKHKAIALGTLRKQREQDFQLDEAFKATDKVDVEERKTLPAQHQFVGHMALKKLHHVIFHT
jgi:hypothetical protein